MFITLSSDDHCSQLRLEDGVGLLALLLLLLATAEAATVEEEDEATPPLIPPPPLSMSPPSHSDTLRSSFFLSTRALLRI